MPAREHSQRTSVPVYFDYASTLCFVAWRVMAPLEPKLDLLLRWLPVHIAAESAAMAPGGAVPTEVRGRLERVAGDMGVALQIPARWLDSRAALEGAVFAEEAGRARAYHEGVFRAVYEAGEDLGDRWTLTRIAGAAGLPIGAFMEFIATRKGASQLAANAADARQRGVAGYPAFLLGDCPLTGIQNPETMEMLIGRHVARAREAAASCGKRT
jgi:predicted DsbA family dithiol-disulfide isomerase